MSVEMRPEIIGLGKARGTNNITNEYIFGRIDEIRRSSGKRELSQATKDEMARRVGIYERGWLNEDEAAAHMAKQSIKMALEMAGVDFNDVKAINVATGLPDFLGVPTGAVIVGEMGGPRNIRTDDMSAACPGFVNALGRTFADLDSYDYGMGGPQIVVAAEPASKGINPNHPETFLIFGDASGAFVMETREVDGSYPKAKFKHRIDPDFIYDLYVPRGGSRGRVDEEALQQHLDCIHMNGPKIKKEAVKRLTEISEEVLDATGVPKSEINVFIPHQANKQIMDEVAYNLGLSDKAYSNIHKYGNTSAASIPVAMREAWEEGKLKNNDIVLIASFGAGLNIGAGIFTMQSLPNREQNDINLKIAA